MNSVIHQLMGDLSTDRFWPAPSALSEEFSLSSNFKFTSGIQNISANTTSTIHTARAILQPKASASGILVPVESEAKPARSVVYTPVSIPICSGNFALITAGSSTLFTPIPTDIITVPANRPTVPANDLMTSPARRTIRLMSIVLPAPIFLLIGLVAKDIAANVSRGSVVSIPAAAADSPRSA